MIENEKNWQANAAVVTARLCVGVVAPAHCLFEDDLISKQKQSSYTLEKYYFFAWMQSVEN